jgi:hypothetical protein
MVLLMVVCAIILTASPSIPAQFIKRKIPKPPPKIESKTEKPKVVEEPKVKQEANSVKSVVLESSQQADIITIDAGGPIERWHDFVLRKGSLIVVDLYNCTAIRTPVPNQTSGQFIEKLRVGLHPDKIRIVAAVNSKVKQYIEKTDNGIKIYIAKPGFASIEELDSDLAKGEPIIEARVSEEIIPPPTPKVEPPKAKQERPIVEKSINGHTLATRVFERDDGENSWARMKMVLIDKNGRERERGMIAATKKFENGLNKNYIQFNSPADIRGTCFLSWETDRGIDDQFIRLPALGRERRISATQKTSRFVNSDYTYEDMQQRKVDSDTHTILKSEVYRNHKCFVLQSVPKNKESSQYSKWVSWVVEDIYIPIKIEYYGKKGKLVKVFTVSRLEKADGFWTSMDSEMSDLKRNRQTLMKIERIEYNSNIPDKVFTRRYLTADKKY